VRDQVSEIFSEQVNFEELEIKSVAVVAGSKDEPELAQFKGEITVWGIEGHAHYLDLNIESIANSRTSYHDLVVCSQALEHVWNHRAFFRNLVALSKPGGYIWIGCPASNFPHDSPEYFSAGLMAAYLENNAESLGLQIIHSQVLSSKRNYIARHAFSLWLTRGETSNPLTYLRRAPTFLGFLHLVWKLGTSLLILALMRESTDVRWGVESVLLCKTKLSNGKSNSDNG
jgi:SAM-dependent methyltransferase